MDAELIVGVLIFYTSAITSIAIPTYYAYWWLVTLPAVLGIILIILILLNVFLGLVISTILLMITVRLRDYVVLYQSYDDNTVIDKLGRLMAAVGMAIAYALRNAFDWFLHTTGIRRVPQEQIEEIEA